MIEGDSFVGEFVALEPAGQLGELFATGRIFGQPTPGVLGLVRIVIAQEVLAQTTEVFGIRRKKLDQLLERGNYVGLLAHARVKAKELLIGGTALRVAFEHKAVLLFRLIEPGHAGVGLRQQIAELKVARILIEPGRDVFRQTGQVADVFIDAHEPQFQVFKEPVAGRDQVQRLFVSGYRFLELL